MHVLLTNDDGYGAAGLEALLAELAEVATVTVVAPAEDHSGEGRTRSGRVAVHEREHGYAVEGTPADCVAYGLRALAEPPGVVVSGCNHGPNVGAYILGHSGTVGAAVEAAFLGVPAIAVSAYHPTEFFPHPPESFGFSLARRATRHLLTETLGSGVFDAADVLNVNVPTTDTAPMRVTRPMFDFDVEVRHDADGGVTFDDSFWGSIDTTGDPYGADSDDNPYDELYPERERYPRDTDRRAMLEAEISVSPLTGPHAVEGHASLDEVVGAWS